MKHTLICLITILTLFITGTGCRNLQPGSDPVLVEAEQLAINAEMTIDKFLLFEFENRALIKNEDVFNAAEYIRHNAPRWLQDLRTTTERYRLSKSATNLNDLQFYMSFIRSTVADIYGKYGMPQK